jgi:hypothetical protein
MFRIQLDTPILLDTHSCTASPNSRSEREANWMRNVPKFVEPLCASHFTVAVNDTHGSAHWIIVSRFSSGVYNCKPAAHVVSFHNCCVSNLNTDDVCDCIKLSSFSAFKHNAQIARPWTRLTLLFFFLLLWLRFVWPVVFATNYGVPINTAVACVIAAHLFFLST